MYEPEFYYHEPNPELWKGRNDAPSGERFFQRVICASPDTLPQSDTRQILFAGFASDAGILRNAGRPGAKLGPDHIRRFLGNLPFHGKENCIDSGNIVCENDQLENAQEGFAKLVDIAIQKGYIPFGLGGGHEIAWAHFQGIAPHYPHLGIINFDAHFDLRPWNPGQPGTSGTPFSQIAHYCKTHQLPFDYCCVGIQSHGNTNSLFEQAKLHHTKFLTAEDIHTKPLENSLDFIKNFVDQHDHIYLSICLDVLSAAFAPGVSAPQPLGLFPTQILPLLKYILQTGKVVSLDIAEFSPPLDENEKTARLAAMLTAEIIATII